MQLEGMLRCAAVTLDRLLPSIIQLHDEETSTAIPNLIAMH